MSEVMDMRVKKIDEFESLGEKKSIAYYVVDNGHGSYVERFQVDRVSIGFRINVFRPVGWTFVLFVQSHEVTDEEHAVATAYNILTATAS